MRIASFLSHIAPAWKRAAGKEGLGGPLAEVDGEGDAMAVVACEDHHLFAARMAAKDRSHSFGEKNGSAPAIGNTHRGEGRVQVTDAIFKRAETGGGFAVADVIAAQIVCGVFARAGAKWKARWGAYIGGDETGAKNGAIRIEQASPQIRKGYGIKRTARGKANGLELRSARRSGSQPQSEVPGRSG